MICVVSQTVFHVVSADEDSAGVWSGYVSGQGRGFWQNPQFDDQRDGDLSFALEPEYYKDWNNGLRAVTFKPFARLDSTDPERSHVDIREAHYLHVLGDWEWRVGVAKVFWGVTESQHLVDIINQTDLVENLDTEDKLGQPMIETTWLQDWGVVQFYVLPGFRERTFPGRKGRLRTGLVVDTDEEEYESGAEEHHVDWALRLKTQLGPFDLGLSHFNGTSRSPELRTKLNSNGSVELIPYYGLIDQTGLDLQAILGNWTWKLESILQTKKGRGFTAAVGGFEYTFYGVSESGADLGVLSEYHFDDRHRNAPVGFQDDMFLGARYVLNDAQDTQLLAGGFYDFDYSSKSVRVELQRRFSDSWKLESELQMFSDVASEDPLHTFHRDDYFQVDLAYYF
ncbi:MAG: hypothetical protein GKR92_08490 [Gammaproteobacteria bacterium]|nr:MAG: hypothetical protein GKR92_08490 [Gammaproteobacteria bacterium]